MNQNENVVLALLLVVVVPAVLMWAEKKVKVIEIIGPVLLCYGIGLLLGNVGIAWPTKFLEDNVSSAAVPLAIPLLMFQSNPRDWFKVAKGALMAFGVGIIAVITAIFIAYFVIGHQLEEGSKAAAMLVGVYTGGTPNLVAIGAALQITKESIPTLIMLDTVLCAIYLLFLLSLAERVFGIFLKKSAIMPLAEVPFEEEGKGSKILKSIIPFLLSAVCLGAGIGISLLLFNELNSIVVLLTITIAAFLLSMSSKVNALPNSYNIGQYFILVFCLAIGLMSDFSTLKGQDSNLIIFCVIVVYGSIILHVFFAKLLKLDVHNVMITSTAALFGPAFVGMVASRLKNPGLVTSGMTTGVIGYVIANFLGLLVFKLLNIVFH